MTRTLDNLVGQQTVKSIELDVKGLDARSVVVRPRSSGGSGLCRVWWSQFT